MIAKSKKGPAASANDELEIFTTVWKSSLRRLLRRSYSVEVENSWDYYSLELLDEKPDWEVPKELIAEFLTELVVSIVVRTQLT
jgi:hypothetical protein